MQNDAHWENMKIMLDDDEALEGVEAWLNGQGLAIRLGGRYPERNADAYVESCAGWLLRLVRHARAAGNKQGR
ncbi:MULTISPECIES: hypothetical protein [Cupriavidus]